MSEAGKSQTISAFLAETVARRGDEQALGFVRDGELHWRTWREVLADASSVASIVQSLGVTPGDRVAQVSENRYEWIITDLALHLVGAVHVPIHVTLSGEQIAAQVTDSGARLAFVSTGELMSKFERLIDPSIAVIRHDRSSAINSESSSGQPCPPVRQDGDELATILYTSGTTGKPRGVMLSHRNLATNAAATADAFEMNENQLRLNILPLSHIYARTCDLYTWVYRGCRLVLAESRETLARDCQIVRPTTLNAVPYLYQKIADRVRGATGDAEAQAKNLRAFFGGHIEQLCCGGAPLAPDAERWFSAHGMPVLPGYGLTESSPVIAVSTPSCKRFGTVGRPLSNVEVRIAADGEILTRGSHVMRGYWQDEATTAEAIRDGWLHTGDFGSLDAENYLSIRGRKKELIVLSTGKKAHPARIESLLTSSPWIEQAAVFGEGQPYLVALIVPAATDAQRPATSDLLAAEITTCLAGAAHEEQIRRFAVLERPFSIERGEVTAKLSLCRDVIAHHFESQIASLFQGSSGVPSQGSPVSEIPLANG